MTTLQQQKDYIDQEAQRAKDEADIAAKEQRQTAADEESARIRKTAEDEVKKIQYDAQK
jgi:hypothetical protein